MATLRKSQAKQGWRSQRSQSADLTREINYPSPTIDKFISSGETWNSSLSSSTLGLSNTSSSLPSLDLNFPRSLGSSSIHSTSSLRTTGSLSSSTDFTSSRSNFMSTNPLGSSKQTGSTSSLSLHSSPLLDTTSHEIDRILARIDQDNRILAELEKSRATVGSPVSSANIERLRAHIEEDNKQLENLTQPLFPLKQSVTVQHLNQLMEKLEQDNKILAELDRKRANIGISPGSVFTPMTSQLNVPTISAPGSNILSMTPSSSTCSTPLPTTSLLPNIPTFGGNTMPTMFNAQIANTVSYTVPSMIATTITPQTYNREENAITTEDILRAVDYIDLPGRGRCKIYIARYSYDPLKQSPNDNPEAELSLNAGDYLIITGEMDEDGFFSGELLDGRKGLVPSNFVEKLTGEDLFDFQATVIYGNRDSDDSSASYTFAPDLDLSGSDDFHVLPPEDFHRMNDYIDLEDIQEVDEENLSDFEREGDGLVPPPPQRLILERQLNKSILIGWLPPEVNVNTVDTYHVYVDGVLKASVKATERTRALVEGVDSLQPHRISVRSVAPTGHHSPDAACTIVVGKDVPLAPSCVKASNITSTSAIISWLPSNSNFQHVVAVNSVELRSVKPGIFRHTISGLAPNTTYRVSVRAKPGRLLYNDEKNPRKLEMLTTYVDFKTLPKGLPDPPLNIQIEAGPQDGTLLVTWLPVVVNTSATNAAPVTGYAVFAGGKKIAEVDSPTGDHALLDMTTIQPFDRKSVTVRTKSGENMSSDSMPCVIPIDLLRGHAKEREKSLSINENGLDQDREMSHDRTDTRMLRQSPRIVDVRTRDRLMERASPPRSQRDHIYRMEDTLLSANEKRRFNRLLNERRNSSGQIIIEPEDNLSDKEIYPPTHMTIPSIEITKDTTSEGCNSLENFSEEEYDAIARHERRMGSVHYPRAHKSKIHGHYYSDVSTRRHMPQEHEHGYYNPRSTSHRRSDDYRSNDYRESMGYHSRHGEYSSRSYPPDNRARWFVALFDYDPMTMSPNPDAAEEELPFQEGQLIKIYGDKDADGFYRGEANGQIGYVPCNMVSEVQVEEEDMSHQLINENVSSRSHHTHHSISAQGNRGSEQWGNSMPVRRMVALYDYDPQELSPNVDAESHERRYNMRGPPIAPSTPHQPRPKTLQTKDALVPNVQDMRETTLKGPTSFLTGLFTPQKEVTMTQEELFNAGKQRPTTLDLKGKLWAYQPFGGSENKAPPNQVGESQSPQGEKKGILSSVKDMFKPLWRN